MNKQENIKQFELLKEEYEMGLYGETEEAQVLSESKVNELYATYTKSNINTKPNIQIENKKITSNDVDDSVILVFCSAKNPGGGVISGSIAQEEDISRVSTWYFHVKDNNEFYDRNKASALNKDLALFIRNGLFVKDQYGYDITPKNVSFVGICAPNLKGMKDRKEKINLEKIKKTIRKRIEMTLKIAQISKRKNCILGAWGCGVFGLEPAIVAKIFKEEIEKGYYNGNIQFLISDIEKVNIFENIILKNSLITETNKDNNKMSKGNEVNRRYKGKVKKL